VSDAAPVGSPLHAALIGAEDFPRTVAFYRDGVGLDALEVGEWAGAHFEHHFGVPAGTRAVYAVLADGGSAVGRIVVLGFQPTAGRRLRTIANGCGYGLLNLNFYARDLCAAARRLVALGCQPWSEPVRHEVDAATGAPTILMLDGPDGVIVNLVELTDDDPRTRVGQMRAHVAGRGYTRTGLTPVVTTQHCVRDVDAAATFYEQACGMRHHLDTVLDSPEQNRFHRYSAGTRSRVAMMVGADLFGKVALIAPDNRAYADLAGASAAPAVGYLAQSFIVPQLDAALAAARRAGAVEYSPPITLPHVPGLGGVHGCIVRSPGSGALVQLLERAS
jgi:catechol 2,3-dioxygenase-like lactoylglutathione lyase family enzyme